MRIAKRTPWAIAFVLLITGYGALLRLDSFVGKYGELDHPSWARVLTRQVAPLAKRLRPRSVQWGRLPHPYVGGDPATYLTYARQMTSFYQPHVREPVFLATTRLALRAVKGQDAGISLASAAASTLAIFAVYLLGAALVSRPAGLLAAGLYAIEYDAITWSVDGWRDDTFTAFFLLAAWSLLLFRKRPTFGRALVVGVMGGLAALTRLTALSFVVPALVWIAIERRAEGRRMFEYGAVAVTILAALVVPFLIACAIATGDPFFAVNYHTGYYRHGEGLPASEPMSALQYIGMKFTNRPLATFDVAAMGLLFEPFLSKWHPYAIWLRGLPTVLSVAALAGLTSWMFSAAGRFALLILATSLLPYAFTWNIAGGGEWRFTMHVYGIYLVAAAATFVWTARVVRRAITRDRLEWPGWRRMAVRGAVVAVAVAVAAALYVLLPWFVKREAMSAGEAVSVEASPRDRVFFRRGWSPLRLEGVASVRVSLSDRVSVHFPLPRKRAYDVVLRMDPVAPDVQRRVTVLFNRQLIGPLQLSWDPQRVGSYRLPLSEAWVRRGDNEVTLVSDAMVTAAAAGPRFGWLDPRERIGLRFWYLRVLD